MAIDWVIVYYTAAIMYSLWSSYKAGRQKSPTPAPGELSATTVDAASHVPVLFGTRLLTSANCVWWGDVGTTAIKSKGGGKK